MSLKVPRISIKTPNMKNYSKIVRSCLLSKKIYNNAIYKDLLIERKGSCLYICFKGCSTLSDFITSVDIRNCRIHGEAVGIHNGFCERSKSLKSEVDYSILSNCMKHNIQDVVFTGHSAGGSTAKIFSLFSYDSIGTDVNLHCYTFGSPKTGDECFKDAIEVCLQDNLLRVETYNDIVCLLPMQNKFQHVGNALILENGKIFDCEGISDNFNFEYKKDQLKFFQYYHSDYLPFVRDIQEKGLLNKYEIHKMINEHSCDSYSSNIMNLITFR